MDISINKLVAKWAQRQQISRLTQDRRHEEIGQLAETLKGMGGDPDAVLTKEEARVASKYKAKAACEQDPERRKKVLARAQLMPIEMTAALRDAILERAAAGVNPTAPSVPSLPTAPTTTTTTATAAQPPYKPAAPKVNADMLAKLIAGVFGTGTLQALDSRPLKRDEKFGAAVAKSQWCASSAADVRATYKPQAAAPTEAERMAAYKNFLFAHHVNVAGLDYSDLGEPKACPLTAKQQAVAQRLTDEFFAVVQGKESAKFSTSPAARAGREFLKAQSTPVKS